MIQKPIFKAGVQKLIIKSKIYKNIDVNVEVEGNNNVDLDEDKLLNSSNAGEFIKQKEN